MPSLDHVFCFVDSFDETSSGSFGDLVRAGFRLQPVHTHPGQGTDCRCTVFPAHYLEWIRLRSRVEAETNPLRLDRRADWRSTGCCPFGVGLRGLGREELDVWRPYQALPLRDVRPPLRVHPLAWDPSPLPMVFASEAARGARADALEPRRQARYADGLAFAHARRIEGIRSVVVSVPSDVPLALSTPAAGVTVRPGERFTLDVALEGEPFPAVVLLDGLVTLHP